MGGGGHNAAHSASHNQQWCKIILRALRGLHVLPKLEYTAHVNKEDDMLALEIRSLWVNPHFATTLSSCARCYGLQVSPFCTELINWTNNASQVKS
jgi:hypothetical protein